MPGSSRKIWLKITRETTKNSRAVGISSRWTRWSALLINMDKRVKLGKTTWAKAPGQKTVRPKQEGMGSKNVLTQKKKKRGGERYRWTTSRRIYRPWLANIQARFHEKVGYSLFLGRGRFNDGPHGVQLREVLPAQVLDHGARFERTNPSVDKILLGRQAA